MWYVFYFKFKVVYWLGGIFDYEMNLSPLFSFLKFSFLTFISVHSLILMLILNNIGTIIINPFKWISEKNSIKASLAYEFRAKYAI